VRRIPPHVIARNRATADADRNAQYYATPKKPGGRCARCGKVEDDHFAGQCDDWGPYTPAVPAEQETV
jgi:hypothetical protein